MPRKQRPQSEDMPPSNNKRKKPAPCVVQRKSRIDRRSRLYPLLNSAGNEDILTFSSKITVHPDGTYDTTSKYEKHIVPIPKNFTPLANQVNPLSTSRNYSPPSSNADEDDSTYGV